MPKLSTTKRPPGVSRDALRRADEKRKRDEAAEGRKASQKPDDKHLIAINEPAARLQGGPRDGAVYYVSDLEKQQRAYERMGGQFEYVATKRHCVLPWTGGVQGVIWRWQKVEPRAWPATPPLSPMKCEGCGCALYYPLSRQRGHCTRCQVAGGRA